MGVRTVLKWKVSFKGLPEAMALKLKITLKYGDL